MQLTPSATESVRDQLNELRFTERITDVTGAQLETGLTLLDIEWEAIGFDGWLLSSAPDIPCACETTSSAGFVHFDQTDGLTDLVRDLRADGLIEPTAEILLITGIKLMAIQLEETAIPDLFLAVDQI